MSGPSFKPVEGQQGYTISGISNARLADCGGSGVSLPFWTRMISLIQFMTRIMLDSHCTSVPRSDHGLTQVRVLTEIEQRDLHYRELVEATI